MIDLDWEDHIASFLEKEIGYEIYRPDEERSRFLFQSFKHEFQQRGVKIITIGGTNGKGQTARKLTSLFASRGLKVCTWTSPHRVSITERFIDECDKISPQELESFIIKSFQIIKSQKIKCSYYEFLFYCFLSWAQQKACEVLIFEVGLGGRLDAVNAFDADCAVITSISRDHVELLGHRYDLILKEKLGITRSGAPLFCAFELKYLEQWVGRYCQKTGVIHHRPFLSGPYDQRNDQLAVVVDEYLAKKWQWRDKDLSYKAREYVIDELTIGRNRFIFKGSHNVDGLRALVAAFDRPVDFALCAFSYRTPAELMAMLKILGQLPTQLVVTTFEHFKALSSVELKEVLEPLKNRFNYKYEKNWKRPIKELVLEQSGQKTQVSRSFLVTGSYYFVAQVQAYCLRLSSFDSKPLCDSDSDGATGF